MTTVTTSQILFERARALAEVFRGGGRELFLVGGCVRDQLLGREVHDLDLATDAPPDEIKRLVSRSRVRPDGVYEAGAKFGTIGLLFRDRPAGTEGHDGRGAGHDESGDVHIVEITTYRTEQYVDGTRRPVVAFGTSLEADLARRDFTMNAVAQDPLTGALYDPFGGRDDIAGRLIRAVGDPRERFADDPLRLLRAVRFVAQLGFIIEPATLEAIRSEAHTLQRISRERIAGELTRILLADRAANGLRLATDLGLMQYAIPEVLPMRGVSQRPLHHKDVFEHTLGVVRNLPPTLVLRWAALLHDIGKPQTKSVHDGAVHFFGHEDVGERLARRILRGLHFDNHLVDRVAKLVRMHLRINAYDSEWTDAAVRRVIREAGDELDDLIQLSRADVTSYRQERVLAANLRADEFARRTRELLEREDVAHLKSPLDGNDLMALFGRPPGPWIKPIKDHLLGLVIDGELDQNDKETATRLARELAARQEHDAAAAPATSPRRGTGLEE